MDSPSLHGPRPRASRGAWLRDPRSCQPSQVSCAAQQTLPPPNLILEQRPVERRPLSLGDVVKFTRFGKIWTYRSRQETQKRRDMAGSTITVTATQAGRVWARRVAAPTASGRGVTYLQTSQLFWPGHPPQSPHSSLPRVPLAEFSAP